MRRAVAVIVPVRGDDGTTGERIARQLGRWPECHTETGDHYGSADFFRPVPGEARAAAYVVRHGHHHAALPGRARCGGCGRVPAAAVHGLEVPVSPPSRRAVRRTGGHHRVGRLLRKWRRLLHAEVRSEEHTSELQSLMRLSYA